MNPTKYPDEVRRKLWPAQDAIVSNATTTVPLLREAAANDSLSLTMRVWAVRYLLYLDPVILQWNGLQNCREDFLESCLAVGVPVFRWKDRMPADKEIYGREERAQGHRVLLFQKKIRGYLDQRVEEARQKP